MYDTNNSSDSLITHNEKDNRISQVQIIQKTCCEKFCCCFPNFNFYDNYYIILRGRRP